MEEKSISKSSKISPMLLDDGFSVEYLRIPTVDDARGFVEPISPEERAWRGEAYFNELLASPRSRLGIGEHDRAEAYIFGNGDFPKRDNVAHLNHFPVPVKVMKMDELFVAPGEVVDLAAYPDEFPWPVGDSEIYLHLTVNKLILSAESKLVIKGNVFIFNCLKAVGNNLGGDYAVIELGASDLAQHSQASRLFPDMMEEMDGGNGSNGRPLRHKSTPLGTRVSAGSVECEGVNGGDGKNGADGTIGANGAMLFLSDLRFHEFVDFPEGSILLKAGAAPGFPGGNGRNGGRGGNGGNGTSGEITPFGVVAGFCGGNGGNGGHGGNGGRGGHGGLACDLFVSVPQRGTRLFRQETIASPGGKGGDGGKGGKGGAAGTNGELYIADNGRATLPDGEDGADGSPGGDGKTRGAPHIHFFENRLTN